MSEVEPSKHELRCFCSRQPLLGVYGLDRDGDPYIHIKIYKQQRIYGEWVFKAGLIKIKCRECFRWYNIQIHRGKSPELTESEKPIELDFPLPEELETIPSVQ
jgi:hypothetical protein